MAKQPKSYERLTRSRLFLNGSGSLWLGKDHLLQVNNVFAVENYRRWFLREIQAFVVRRTNTRLIWNIVFGIFALFFLGTAAGISLWAFEASTTNDRVGPLIVSTVLGVVGVGFVVLLLVNTGMGPGCTVSIQTPHGVDRLNSPKRIPAFEKLAARLQPLIDSAQMPAETAEPQVAATPLEQPQLS